MSVSCILMFLSLPVAAQQRTLAPAEFVDWLPISDAERQMKSPVVEKDAGAEILLWRVHVSDEFLSEGLQRVSYNYLRLKVFTAKGKEQVGTVDLPYSEPGAILDVAGRTIKADGSILELDKKSVYKRDLVRASGLKEKVVSFAMPGVDEGAIVEYRWKLTQDDNRFRYVRLEFTRDLPVQKATYFMKPLSNDYVATDEMYILPFNCRPSPLTPTRDGWTETTVTNIPAAVDEPYAPSDANVHPWALLYYRQGNREPVKYWNDEAKSVYNEFKGLVKTDSEVKTAAAQAAGQARTDEEKIAALTTYVGKRLRGFLDPEVTAAERDDFIKKLPKNRQRNSTEIFKSGIALPSEMNVAFAALAQQVGIEVRPVMVSSRLEASIDPKAIADRYFVDDTALATKAGESWKIFNVSRKNLYPGMLPADQEGMFAIVTDSKGASLVTTPVSSPDASMEFRVAKLKLAASGTLSGDVDEAYTGHRAEQYRRQLEGQSAAQRETWFRERVTRMFPDAEIASLKIENSDDVSKPLHVMYHMEAPLFAQVTGKRILFEPSPFRRSQASPFTSSERRYPIQFPFAWKERDEVFIELPAGFELENADNPGSFDFGEPGGYKLTMSVQKGAATQLFTAREFTFGAKGLLGIQASSYPTIKKIFDEIRLRDTHTLSLRGN